ncbi:hypothetical protein RHMOL_Rhmol11G0065300 [Rhododendron molle]|uniref:Uncharacterized protein n=1 Tax=Rhododendron molle TaxID=49168 RepID=A0ACC0LP73_RHOML|nr:hypothetical protein RHMOL_Rhmol11G0065300 [Rhododendron molle]
MKDGPLDKDQIRMTVRNLQPTLGKHMVMAQACSHFKTFFDTDLAVEEAIQLGIPDKPEPAPAKAKKVYPVLEKLVESDILKLLNPTSLPQKLPASHNPNAYCAYHQNVGHHTNNCFRLRHAIQDLIDNKTIPVLPQKPNTVSNPLPKHLNPQCVASPRAQGYSRIGKWSMEGRVGRYSLNALFSKLELAEEEDNWEWEAKPPMWHQVEDEDPLDVMTLPLLFHGEEIQQRPDLLNLRILFRAVP